MFNLRHFVFSIGLSLVMSVHAVRAGWEPPKDGVMTEKQVVNYLQVTQDAMNNLKAAGKAAEGIKSGPAAMAIYLNTDAKFKATLASHGLSQEEYNWAGERVGEAWGALTIDQLMADAVKGLAEQRKNNELKIVETKQKLAAYQKAQTQGRKVLNKEDREAAIQSAKGDHQSALDEAKQHTDEAKQAQDEVTKAQADAKAADALAKNPPADVNADDRPGYIEQKKTEVQQATDQAKEALDKVTEAKKLEAESQAKAAAAQKRIADPDLPTTDDEKAEVKKANEEQIAILKNDISEGEQGLKLLDEAAQAQMKSIADERAKNPIPQKNVELLKKHLAEFEAIYGIKREAK